MEKLYQRINYENSPSKKTPLSEANLNKMDKALDDLDNRIIEQDAKFTKSIKAEDKKIEDANGKISTLTDTAATLTQSKSDAITVEKSGTTIVATDSSDKGFEQFKTYGWSEQEKTSGKNLLKNTKENETAYGITLTVDEDGIINLNGTADTDINFTFSSTIPIISGRYANLIQLSGSYNGTIYHVEFDYNWGNSFKSSINVAHALRDDIEYTRFRFMVANGTVCNNLKLGYIVSTDPNANWEPYTGGVASPNPEYEQPIVSAGQKLAEGKNLAKSIEVGEKNAYSNALYIDFDVKPSTEYILSFIGTINNKYYTNEGLFSGYNQVTVVDGVTSVTVKTLDIISDDAYSELGCVLLKNLQNNSDHYFNNVMLRLAEIKDDTYEPYTGGVKKAYDVGIRKKLTNNLLDYIDKYKALGATVSSDGREVIFPTNLQTYMEKLEINYGLFNAGTYYLSVEPIDAPCIRTEIELDGNLIGDTMLVSSVKDFAFTVSKAGELSIKLYTSAGAGSGNVIGGFKNLVLSTEPNTEWQPYTEQTLTLNRVLRGIPVTDSSLANYTDENGQMWCADEIDTDKDGTFAMNGIANALIMLSLQDVCKVNTDGSYILSGCPSDGSENGYRLDVRCDGNTLGIDVGGGITVELNSTKDYSILLRIGIGTVCDNLTFKPMIRPVEIDGIPTSAEYVPYSHGKFTKKRGVLVQRITHYKLTNFVMSYLNAVGTRIFRIAIDALLNTPSSVRQPILCNRVEATTADYQYAFNCNAISIADGAVLMSIKDVTTESTFRNIINSTDYWIAYPLATPIETPLTDAEIAAYKALHSNKPNTIITNDAGCFMEVEYVADTKTHIEQNYVPVSKYTALEDRVSALERLHV